MREAQQLLKDIEINLAMIIFKESVPTSFSLNSSIQCRFAVFENVAPCYEPPFFSEKTFPQEEIQNVSGDWRLPGKSFFLRTCTYQNGS